MHAPSTKTLVSQLKVCSAGLNNIKIPMMLNAQIPCYSIRALFDRGLRCIEMKNRQEIVVVYGCSLN